MKRIAAAIALAGFLPQAAMAGDPASPRLAERASNTWTTMGLGMHIMLGKVGVGDITHQPDESGAEAAKKLVDKQASSPASAPYVSLVWDATRRLDAAGYAMTADGVRAGVDYLPVVID